MAAVAAAAAAVEAAMQAPTAASAEMKVWGLLQKTFQGEEDLDGELDHRLRISGGIARRACGARVVLPSARCRRFLCKVAKMAAVGLVVVVVVVVVLVGRFQQRQRLQLQLLGWRFI